MTLQSNVGRADRAIRIALGLGLLAAAALLETPLRWWGLIGVMPLLTGIFGFCPAYLPFGLSTCHAAKDAH